MKSEISSELTNPCNFRYKRNPGQERMNDLLMNDSFTRILAWSGSRAGKTFEFVFDIVKRAAFTRGSRHAMIRKHFSEAKKYIWLDTLPNVLETCWYPPMKVKWNKSDYYITLPYVNSEIWIGGLDDKERADKILGGEYNTIYFCECSEISYESVVTALTRLAKKSFTVRGRELVNKAYFDENPPGKSHWSYKMFFEHIDPITRGALPNIEKYARVHLKPEENVENLTKEYLQSLSTLTGNFKKRFHLGEFQDEIVGALWRENMINETRTKDHPALARVVIAVDPAVSVTSTSNETGITVEGLGIDGHLYVLADLSGYYSPKEWADKVSFAYDKWQGDRVIGEVNNGGDLVESNITNARPDISVQKVHASRGKMKRAEPIAALYDRRLVHHVGQFVDLEYQMCNYTGDDSDESPDRMDSLVWGLTALTEPQEEQGVVSYDQRVRISSI